MKTLTINFFIHNKSTVAQLHMEMKMTEDKGVVGVGVGVRDHERVEVER